MAIKWKKHLEKDERSALKMRVDVLKETFSYDEMERIIFSELDNMGLKSEYFIDMLDDVLKEHRK